MKLFSYDCRRLTSQWGSALKQEEDVRRLFYIYEREAEISYIFR